MNSFENLNSDGFRLPSEIWSHIFSFLKVKDRKNVRLTCSEWYNACNTTSLVRSEQMIIFFDFKKTNNKPWFDVLMDCPRPSFNFDFVFPLQFPSDATAFWQKLGPRVDTLKLRHSMNENKFIDRMMQFCNNLKKLHIQDPYLTTESNDLFLDWEKLEISHESLKCLVLEHGSLITDFHLGRLFDIYPGIQKLQLIDTQVSSLEINNSRFYENPLLSNLDWPFSNNCLYSNIRSKAGNIKSLVFDRLRCSDLPDIWFKKLSSLPGLKLEELKLNVHPSLTEDAFMTFFANQTHLECIKISKCQHFSLKCFLYMIQNCSNLKDVRVECSDVSSNFLMGEEIFHALLLLPHLKILKLEGVFFTPENVINRIATVGAATFQSLRELTLKMPAIYFGIFSDKIPSNLSALHLLTRPGENGLTDLNLQMIFSKWTNLRSLKLSLGPSVSDIGFCGLKSAENQTENLGVSINRLRRLEKLVLIFDKNLENSITCASVSCFVSPKLRKLKLIHFPKITEKIFELICQNTPSMEYCEFRECEIEDEASKRFKEGWKSPCYFRKFSSHLWH